ncbi:MAG: hypothetical protein JWQ72_3716 [Polaromonas sp.]|nr:hypothetical protein [Polaromonas sp.]
MPAPAPEEPVLPPAPVLLPEESLEPVEPVAPLEPVLPEELPVLPEPEAPLLPVLPLDPMPLPDDPLLEGLVDEEPAPEPLVLASSVLLPQAPRERSAASARLTAATDVVLDAYMCGFLLKDGSAACQPAFNVGSAIFSPHETPAKSPVGLFRVAGRHAHKAPLQQKAMLCKRPPRGADPRTSTAGRDKVRLPTWVSTEPSTRKKGAAPSDRRAAGASSAVPAAGQTRPGGLRRRRGSWRGWTASGAGVGCLCARPSSGPCRAGFQNRCRAGPRESATGGLRVYG